MLPTLLLAAVCLTPRAHAHEDPPGCFETGPAIVTTVFRADGSPLVGPVSECETVLYRARLQKAVESDAVCAFSGGTFFLITPDGVLHTLAVDVPCIGGTNDPCDPSLDGLVSDPVAYTVRPSDVEAGVIVATAQYAGGVAHDQSPDTGGVGAVAPKATLVVSCDDGDACTENRCDPEAQGAAACANPPVDCGDANACTTDACSAGECTHVAPDPTCVPCETDADCDDRNACTSDACVEGICVEEIPDPACVPCETAADCDDGDACTADACDAGVCARTPIAGCPSEVCDDRVDNDGDGLIDCADPDCEGHAACPPELCGNCVDDDGDGLVDYEDDDCCDRTSSLVVRRMKVRTKPEAGRNRLRLKTRWAARAPEGFDPGALGTTLQIRDAEGLLLCQNIPFKSDPLWTRMGVFKFKDKTGTMAAGLRRARFKIHEKAGNRVSFRTKGRKMGFREPVGNELRVTVRVGAQCTQATTPLRTRRARTGKRLVFP